MNETPDPAARRERDGLLGSMIAAGVIGTGAAIWGLVARSGVILFDGIFTVAGIALVSISLLASRAAGSRPTGQYPFGKHAATPLAVAMQGTALLVTLLYGGADAVGTLLAGGSDGEPLSLLIYGSISAVLSLAVAVWLRRRAPDSALVWAEIVSWRAGVWLSLGVAVGGVVAIVLTNTDNETAAGYVDPVLLLIAVALIAPMPVRLIREGMHELLEGAPPAEVVAAIERAVAAVRSEFDLPEPAVRATKLGRRLYVEVDFVIEPHRWEVDDEDHVRRSFRALLVDQPYDVWATVELTTDLDLLP